MLNSETSFQSSDAQHILVTRPQFPDQVKRLEEAAKVTHLTRPKPASPDELQGIVKGAIGIFAHITDFITAEVMDAAGPDLKVIAEFGVGYDNIDVKEASYRNIAVCNTPGILTETTADFAFALIQESARRLTESDRYVRSGNWRWFAPLDLLGKDIRGSTLGIIGFGRIGQAVAQRALNSNMEVLYFSRSTPDDDLGCTETSSLKELLQKSDFVSIHCPLTDQTKKLINESTLSFMKPDGVLINTARGPIVDTEALTKSLQNKQISYASIDVTDPEPIPSDHPLLSLDNVTVLPHIASATVETRRKMAIMTADNILEALKGNRPPYCVNFDKLKW